MSNKCYTLSSKLKKMLYAKIREYKNDIINFEYLKKNLVDLNSLEDVNLLNILNINELNTFSKCVFFEGFSGWVSLNSDNKQRYFTQKGSKKYALDIYDILEIYFNCTYNQIFNRLLEFGMDVQFFNTELDHIVAYMEENKFEQSFLGETSCIYKALIDFNKKHNILNAGDNVFFISTRYLKEKYNIPYSISTINQIINMYDCIGFLNKVAESEIQNKKIQNCLKLKKGLNKISFYSLKEVESLDVIDEKIKALLHEKISYYNLSLRNIKKLQTKYKDLFNKEMTNEKSLNKATHKSEELTMVVKNLFSKYSDQQGVVAKEWLEGELKGVTKTQINKAWNELVNKEIGKVVRPNKRLKLKLGLTTNQDVFLLKKLTI